MRSICLLIGLMFWVTTAEDFSKTEITRKVVVDYHSRQVLFLRYRGREFIGIDSIVTLDHYFNSQIKHQNLSILLLESRKSQIKREMAYGGRGQGLIQTIEVPMPIKGGFGEFIGDATKLDVGGQEKITIGGRQQYVKGYTGEQPSLIPELEMKQELRINLDGQVGDRLKIFIDHDSQRESESKNKVTLTYKGTEDEVIQEIEGGDTQLSIPGTTYTGDIPTHKGLFGIKTTSKIGPLGLVAVASQEKSETQESKYEGKVKADSTVLYGRDYEGKRFYWIGETEEIVRLNVWLDDRYENPSEPSKFAYAYVDSNNDNIPDTVYPADKHAGKFTIQRMGDFYIFDQSSNVIRLNNRLSDAYVLAIAYVTRSGRVVGDTSTNKDSIRLKLIDPALDDPRSFLWHYEMRNVYFLGVGIKMTSFSIIYDVPGAEDRNVTNQGVPYRELLGLDPDNNGLVEWPYFNASDGLLIFPDPYPFASNQIDVEERDTIIYRKPQASLQSLEGKKFKIVVRSVQAAAEYNLPPDVEEGSVKVYINNQVWEEGKDFVVDYGEGKVKFLKPVGENDDVKITYETMPLFSAAQKSLLGMRASMNPFAETKFGSSLFYRSEGYPDEHPRLKSEPHRRVVCEFDVAHPQRLDFVTDAIDWLPLVETEAQSNLNLNFETALSFSNLNTKGKVYIDDFERTTITSDLTMGYRSWYLASLPHNKSANNFAQKRLIWFNPEAKLTRSDIFINPDDPQDLAEVLKIYFEPQDENTFAGLTQALQFGEDLDECENLEVIVKGKGGRLHIDIGTKISEDQLRRNGQGELVGLGTFETEDRDNNGTWDRSSEDTGLDGVYGTDPNAPGDDGNDDFSEEITKKNGTENNGIYDTEDINHDTGFLQDNAYYSYSIDLDSTRYLIANAELQPGWKMFRIPIKDSLNRDTVYSAASPNWEHIYYFRIWLDGFNGPETLTIYTISAVGSRWQNKGIVSRFPPPHDSTEEFVLSPVNTRTHTYYKPPYPLLRDEFGRLRSEGALEFRIRNLQRYHEAIAYRPTDEAEDYREYDTISFLIHTKRSNPLISIRFGSDSANYYQYTSYANSVPKGYNDYREIKMSLKDFIDLKRITEGDSIAVQGNYMVMGNPSISAVRFFQIAIRNQDDELLSDTIWVNDIRLSSPKSEVGRISQGSVGLTMADLASFNLGLSESNGRFKRLSESKGIGLSGESKSLNFSSTVNLNKILLDRWHFSIPLSYSHSQSQSDPRFAYFSEDLELSSVEAKEQRTSSRSDRYGFSFAKSNSRHWLTRYTFDNLSLSGDLSKSTNRTITTLDSTRQFGLRGGYRLDPKIGFSVGRERFSLAPQSINFQTGYNDNYSTTFSRRNMNDPYRRNSRPFRSRLLSPSFSLSYSPHQIINTNYSFSQVRDSVSSRRRFGEEVSRNQGAGVTVAQNLFIISPTIALRGGYNEDHSFAIRTPENLRNVGNSSDYSVSSGLELGKVLKSLCRLRDESKDTLVLVGSPQWVLSQIERFSNQIRDPSFSFIHSRSSSYQMVKARPSSRYQFGLIDTLPAEFLKNPSLQNRAIRNNLNTSSGLSISAFNIAFGYNKSIGTNYAYATNNTKTITDEYPDLSISIGQVERLPFLSKYVNSSSINTAFNQVVEKRGEFKSDSALKIVELTRTYDFSPLASWQLNWKKGVNSSIEFRHSQGYSISYDQGEYRRNHKTQSLDASLAYSFSAPTGINFPVLRYIRFTSTLSINVTAGYSKHVEWLQESVNRINDVSTFSSRLGLSYQFSSSINGGSDLDYAQNKNNLTSQTTNVIGLNFWVLFLF